MKTLRQKIRDTIVARDTIERMGIKENLKTHILLNI